MVPAIGYAIREQNRYILDEPALTGVEITFERADDPLRLEKYVGEDRKFDYVSIHALKLSPGSYDSPSTQYMDALLAIAEENGAVSISDHLGFTRDGDGGVEMGHFSPLPYNEQALDAVCRNLMIIQDHLKGYHFFLENAAALYMFKGTMEEAEFLSRVMKNTGVGWLCDVMNVYANATNFGFDGYEYIREVMQHAPRVQMHLAGGVYDEDVKMVLDTHSEPVPDEVWKLYKFALEQGHGKVDAVFIERDQEFPDESGWRGEVRKAKQIADDVSNSMAQV